MVEWWATFLQSQVETWTVPICTAIVHYLRQENLPLSSKAEAAAANHQVSPSTQGSCWKQRHEFCWHNALHSLALAPLPWKLKFGLKKLAERMLTGGKGKQYKSSVPGEKHSLRATEGILIQKSALVNHANCWPYKPTSTTRNNGFTDAAQMLQNAWDCRNNTTKLKEAWQLSGLYSTGVTIPNHTEWDISAGTCTIETTETSEVMGIYSAGRS